MKSCIIGEIYRSMTSGRNIASIPFDCLRNRQTNPLPINQTYTKDLRFLLKRHNAISHSLWVALSVEAAS
jgi:hypothetical protein